MRSGFILQQSGGLVNVEALIFRVWVYVMPSGITSHCVMHSMVRKYLRFSQHNWIVTFYIYRSVYVISLYGAECSMSRPSDMWNLVNFTILFHRNKCSIDSWWVKGLTQVYSTIILSQKGLKTDFLSQKT